MLAQQIETQLPRALPVPEAPFPGQGIIKIPFQVTNPAAGVLWFRFRTQPFLFKVEPSVVSLKPGQTERVTVELDAGRITRDNHKSLAVIAAWSLLENEPGSEKVTTRNGEYRIDILCPPPRRLFACPDPKCANPILEGDRLCRHCGALLQYCPTCQTPALRTAAVCNALAQHPLPRRPDWAMPGGNPGRAGSVPEVLKPEGSLAWRYAPPSPKASATIEWSAPVVGYNMVFLAGAVAGTWSRLIALDLETGAELWQLPLPENDAVYPYRAGPVAANGFVYVATFNGYILGIDAARGKRRWAARVPHQVYGGCLAAGNALFVGTVHPDGESGALLALWPDDGETVWTARLEGRLDTPLAGGKGRIFACTDDGHVAAVQAKDGEALWRQPSEGQFEGGPIFDGELLYCANAKGELIALDAATGEPRWKETLPAAAEASPALHSGRLYCGCADGTLQSYTTDGKRIGSAAVGAQMRAAPVPTMNGAVFGAEDGTLHLSDALRFVSPLYQTEPGTRISAPVAVSGTRVIMAATNGTVYAVDVAAED